MQKTKTMFSFFKKKHFIADYLEGLTDMHCHLLPGIDDGSENDEMSLEMIKQYQNLGYVGAIATPHVMDGFYNNTSVSIAETLKNFKKVLSEKGVTNFKVNAAAEYMLDKGFDELVVQKDFLQIHKDITLVEMSYFQMTNHVDYQIFNLQQLNLRPILAHPERYTYIEKPEGILEFKKKGCFLQLNLLSLSGHYGPNALKQANYLLSNGHYDFVGTDAHHPRHLRKIKEMTITSKLVPSFEQLINKTKENLSN